MSASSPSPRRVRQRHIDWLTDRLSPRDEEILNFFRSTRLLTGSMIERLAFTDLVGRSRSVVRWRVLKRLVDWRVLLPLDRRIGGFARGSAGAIYALDSAGQILVRLRTADQDDEAPAPRRPTVPGERFIRHVLTVSELFVQLVEATRCDRLQFDDFRAEPAAWVPDGLGGWLKPDAFVALSAGEITDDWFVEVDLASEHLPTIRRKAETYLDFFQRGQLGPNGVMPRVLITVPNERRQDTVQRTLDHLAEPAATLLHVVTHAQVVHYLVSVLRE